MRFFCLISTLILILSCGAPSGRLISDYERMGTRYIEKAKRELNRGNIDGAFKNIHFAYDISQKNNLPYLKTHIHLELVGIYSKLGNLKEAEKNLYFAEEIIKKDAKELMPYLMLNKAFLLYKKGAKDEAKKLALEIKKVPKELIVYNDILQAMFAKDEKRYENFEKILSKALKEAKKEEEFFLESYIHKLLSEYYFEKKDDTKAIEHLKEALNIDRSIENLDGLIYSLQKLARYYETSNDKENGFYYYYQLWEMTSSRGDYQKSQYYLEKAYNLLGM